LSSERNSLEQLTVPDSSRVWLFGAQRLLSDKEFASIQNELSGFVFAWQAHGKNLTADFCVLNRCVVVVAVDESKEAPSGCSIDKVFHLLQSQKEKYDLDFFQRTLVWVLKGNDICILNKLEVQAALDSGEIHRDAPTMNMLAQSLGDLKEKGLTMSLSDSWIAPKLKFTHEG